MAGYLVYNKKIKSLAIARWDANTQGGFAIMPHMSAPVIEKLGNIQHKSNLGVEI